MRILPFGAIVALAAAAMCQQPALSQRSAPTITIRMLNGKSGKPVAGDLSNVWLGNGKTQILKTDKHGEIRLSVEGVEPRTIGFLPNYYEDCRYKKATPAGMYIRISIDEILANGVVAENHCGKQHQATEPGVLVIYVRDFTFLERWRS